MNRLARIASSTAAALALFVATSAARADGFNARVYRTSSDAYGVGSLDGARAPNAGYIVPSVATDVAVAPVTLDHGGVRDDIVSARWVVEPQLTFGLGSSFGLYARAPFIARDWGNDVYGRPLPASGVLPPSLGVIVPLARDPRNDGRLALRLEAAAPIGTTEEMRGDGDVTGRAAFVYSGRWQRTTMLATVGGQLAPVRGIGEARIGRAITGGYALRVPLSSSLLAFGSVEVRFDVDVADQSSALAGLGLEAR